MSFSVNDIYTSMLGGSQSYQASSLSGAGSSSSLSNLAATTELQNTIENAQTDEELMEACKSFEQYFLEQVFKEMEKTTNLFGEEDSDSSAKLVDFFKDSAIEDLASQSTEQNSLGLAQMLFEQMKRNYEI